MNTKRKNFRQEIISAIENIDSNKEILNLYEILNEVSEYSGIDLSTIRKNKEYHQLCIDGFKKHICNQVSDKMYSFDFNGDKDTNNLQKENTDLKERLFFVEKALSKKINDPDLEHLRILKLDLLKYFENDDKFIIKEDKFYYGTSLVVQSIIIKLLFNND